MLAPNLISFDEFYRLQVPATGEAHNTTLQADNFHELIAKAKIGENGVDVRGLYKTEAEWEKFINLSAQLADEAQSIRKPVSEPEETRCQPEGSPWRIFYQEVSGKNRGIAPTSIIEDWQTRHLDELGEHSVLQLYRRWRFAQSMAESYRSDIHSSLGQMQLGHSPSASAPHKDEGAKALTGNPVDGGLLVAGYLTPEDHATDSSTSNRGFFIDEDLTGPFDGAAMSVEFRREALVDEGEEFRLFEEMWLAPIVGQQRMRPGLAQELWPHRKNLYAMWKKRLSSERSDLVRSFALSVIKKTSHSSLSKIVKTLIDDGDERRLESFRSTLAKHFPPLRMTGQNQLTRQRKAETYRSIWPHKVIYRRNKAQDPTVVQVTVMIGSHLCRLTTWGNRAQPPFARLIRFLEGRSGEYVISRIPDFETPAHHFSLSPLDPFGLARHEFPVRYEPKAKFIPRHAPDSVKDPGKCDVSGWSPKSDHGISVRDGILRSISAAWKLRFRRHAMDAGIRERDVHQIDYQHTALRPRWWSPEMDEEIYQRQDIYDVTIPTNRRLLKGTIKLEQLDEDGRGSERLTIWIDINEDGSVDFRRKRHGEVVASVSQKPDMGNDIDAAILATLTTNEK